MSIRQKRMYPHTITVINLANDKGIITGYLTEIDTVLYQDKQKVRTGGETHFSDNQGYVQIPNFSKQMENYLDEEDWKKLSDEDKKEYWTLQKNDFILKGTTDKTNYKEIDKKRTIESYEDIDYSIRIGKHIGITLK